MGGPLRYDGGLMDMPDPVGHAETAAAALAKRPPRLAGAVIALLDNSKPNAGVLLDAIGAELRDRHGVREVRRWGKPAASHGAAPALLDEIAATCDAVLTASAD
jgi:hypothetical protein